MKGYLWQTIGRLVAAGLVPEPKMVVSNGTRLDIKLRSREDVDRWSRHLGMPPRVHTGAEYGSRDFLPAPGWCGFTTVTVYCDQWSAAYQQATAVA